MQRYRYYEDIRKDSKKSTPARVHFSEERIMYGALPASNHKNRWDSPIRTLSMGRFRLFLFKQNLLAFQKEVLYNSTCR